MREKAAVPINPPYPLTLALSLRERELIGVMTVDCFYLAIS
jgi:hypothetical protein